MSTNWVGHAFEGVTYSTTDSTVVYQMSPRKGNGRARRLNTMAQGLPNFGKLTAYMYIDMYNRVFWL